MNFRYFQVLMHRFRLKKQHVEILVETVQLLTEQIMMDEAHPMNQEVFFRKPFIMLIVNSASTICGNQTRIESEIGEDAE